MQEISGYIERITYQSSENGYTVAQIQERGKKDLSCLVGFMPSLQPGETVRCVGAWKNHLMHGRQFEVTSYRQEAPADVIGIEKYLGSGLIKGIGPAYAKRIVEKFGLDTLSIIDAEPEQLQKIPGLGPKRIDKIKACWSDQRSIRDVMVFLQSKGVSPAYAQKIFKTYGEKSVQILNENPYRLARDIFGIGFKSADKIARELGIEKNSARRIDAGVEFVLGQLSSEGHVCSPIDFFLEKASHLLEVPSQDIEQRLPILIAEERLSEMSLLDQGTLKSFLWLKPLWVAETTGALRLKELSGQTSGLRSIDLLRAIDWVQNELKIELATEQKEAVKKGVSEKVSIITGGPGTGKSTITKAILAISQKLTQRIILAAPTGKAAKRMTEICSRKASTIHSLLEFDFKNGKFKRNQSNPLECDLIIIDEASMIDTLLFSSLVKAIPLSARVIFVGDVDQLPSVGPGKVLKDLIDSNLLTVTRLKEIFRQAAGSKIITNAHKINQGLFPDLAHQEGSDFFFIEEDEPEKVLQLIKTLATERVPRRYGFDPFHEIQVMAPMRKGVIGIDHLNEILQEVFHPNKAPLFRSGRKFVEGDKVMQLKNNYEKEIFNGDIGIVQTIDHQDQMMQVKFDERMVEYDFSDLDELTLSYAVSVHKYQGSECPCIIMPVHTSHFMLLFRNLLYTAVTRAKKLFILVGSKKALAMAINKVNSLHRYTGLKEALSGYFNQLPI